MLLGVNRVARAAKIEKFRWSSGQCFGTKGFMGLSFSIKSPEMHTLAIVLNGRNPLGMSFMPISPFKASAMWSSIKGILLGGGLSEIDPSIVEPIPVDVVHESLWPFSGHPEPCQPMSHKRIPGNSNFDMAMFYGPGNFSYIPSSSTATLGATRGKKPCEFSAILIIVKNGAEIFRRNICLWSHPAQYIAPMFPVKFAASGGQ